MEHAPFRTSVPNIRDARSLGHLGTLGTWSYALASCSSLARQATLVDLKVGSSENAQISGNAVACGGKVTRSPGTTSFARKCSCFSVADDVTMVRKRFIGEPQVTASTVVLVQRRLGGQFSIEESYARVGLRPVRTMTIATLN